MRYNLKIGQRVYIKVPGGLKHGVVVGIKNDKTIVQFEDSKTTTHFTPREMKFINVWQDGDDVGGSPGKLIESLETEDGQFCLLSVEPQMLPYNDGVSPTGKYTVDCIHPTDGFHTFIIEQNGRYSWEAVAPPVFISDRIVTWLGLKIENQQKYFQ